ncbi:DUF21 domain-containing protein At4g14240-like isoform X2 [Magnolia sinica]|uniref:DUF21 domain-containing protein At4g14240-like isoform X2 n=1 Tax=Magnolia sinica TaxID=86752 RepID=UPI00265A1D6E|nr:DUF21 domain-containing protein At4g14240-like isoform X2 [Magnolia sinica]
MAKQKKYSLSLSLSLSLSQSLCKELMGKAWDFLVHAENIEFSSFRWFAYVGASCFLILFAGLMSGLTLAFMSLSLVDLEVLQRSGTSDEKKQAASILPVLQKQHHLLVTLLLCNACAMEGLPICLDRILHPLFAIVMSVTLVLAFGEVIPQAICARYGLSVGANFVWLVRILMIICYPIAYPMGKAGKGGELTHDETTIISGALDLTEKTAELAMTPIESTFSLDVNSKLDRGVIGKILSRGHSRIPIYSGNLKNVIGLLLVKSLLTVRAEEETPISAVSIRRIPRVPADMPLYHIFKEFLKGSSHMAAVVKAKRKFEKPPLIGGGEKSEETKVGSEDATLTTHLLSASEKSESFSIDIEKGMNSQGNVNTIASSEHNVAATNAAVYLSDEVIGIITLEDVFEEILQEEIVDETDEYIDVHKGIPVSKVAANYAVARVRSFRRLASQKGGVTPKKSNSCSSNSTKFKSELLDPPLGPKS